MGWESPGLAFDVSLHLGSLAAVAWYFRADWAELTRAAVTMLQTRRVESPAQRRVLLLIAATIPAGIGGLLLQDYAESVFRHPAITATTLILLGVILWVVDRYMSAGAHHCRTETTGCLADRAGAGAGARAGCVPVGRDDDGRTRTGPRAASAARFSFLMSIPIIMAAVVFKAPDLLRDGGEIAPMLAGIAAAAVSSWLAITVLLRFVVNNSFGVFALYRVALGLSYSRCWRCAEHRQRERV